MNDRDWTDGKVTYGQAEQIWSTMWHEEYGREWLVANDLMPVEQW